MATQEDDEEDIDPIKVLLPDEDDLGKILSRVLDGAENQQLQRHYLRSIESTVVIRQLPSEGLSFQLWPAATTLVTLLDNHHCNPTTSPLNPTLAALSNSSCNRLLNILELGSGTGVVGIAAAAILGAHVTVTDLPHVLHNLQHNVEANTELLAKRGGMVHVAPVRWGEANDVELTERGIDLVLASDVVYHDHLYDPLIQTLRWLLVGGDKKRVFIMAHLRRWKKDSAFFKKAKNLFDVDIIHVDRPSEGYRTGVIVYRFCGKSQKLNAGSANINSR